MTIEQMQVFLLDAEPNECIDLFLTTSGEKRIVGEYIVLSEHFVLLLAEACIPTATSLHSHEIHLYQIGGITGSENILDNLHEHILPIGTIGRVEIRYPSIGKTEAALLVENDPDKWLIPSHMIEYYDGDRNGERWESLYRKEPMKAGHHAISRYWQLAIDNWKFIGQTNDRASANSQDSTIKQIAIFNVSVSNYSPPVKKSGKVSKRSKRNSTMHDTTREKLVNLHDLRRDKIRNKTPIAKTSACNLIRIDPKTVQTWDKELWEKWDDLKYDI